MVRADGLTVARGRTVLLRDFTIVVGAGEAMPHVFVLDEPWAGLDADARAGLGADIGALAADGSTVLYTDHSGAATIAPTRTLRLGDGGAVIDARPTGEADPARDRSRVLIELAREGERLSLTVDDAVAARLAEGWEIERGEPLR
jgi:ABC-type multidrug transport system ATPase subunit